MLHMLILANEDSPRNMLVVSGKKTGILSAEGKGNHVWGEVLQKRRQFSLQLMDESILHVLVLVFQAENRI